MKSMKDFIGKYPVLKTLRFRLIPIGKTEEHIKENGIIENDQARADAYPIVKSIIDEYHKKCIHEALKIEAFDEKNAIDWESLYNAIIEYRKNKSFESKKNLTNVQAKYRGYIVDALEKFEHFKELTNATPSDLLKKVLPDFCDNKSLKMFDGFASYFIGFQENRKNIYSRESISTGVAYRLVNDNFPKFISNIEVYETLKENYPEIIEQASEELAPYLDGVLIDDIFKINFYNSFLTQSGIDYFNRVIGGVSDENGNKYRGINEFSNLYRQQNLSNAKIKKSMTMLPLFKQILSDRESISFIPEVIKDDKELILSIDKYISHIYNYEFNGNIINIIDELRFLIDTLHTFNPSNIFISSKYITNISQKIYSNWSTLNDNLHEHAIILFGDESKATNKKKIESYLKKDAYNLAELSISGEQLQANYFKDLYISTTNVNTLWESVKEWAKQSDFSNDKEGTEKIKDLLDSIMNILHMFSIFNVSGDYDVDSLFYNDYYPLYAELEKLIPLYNKIRNYLTKKSSDIKKIKIKFDAPTLANGWDQNKEKDNKAILLFKDGKTFLGIINPNSKKKIDFTSVSIKENEECYSKMIYKYLPGPNKMLPKVFFSKKGIDLYNPSEEIKSINKKGSFKQGPLFSIKDLHILIDFYKEGIKQHPDWSKFNFKFNQTDFYKDISSFYNDISKQSYKLRFTNIPVRLVDEWVNNNQLYLFQLYNKDFAKGSKGKKNLHTLYWENVFSESNLKNLVLKLNGDAELFYRPVSVKKPIIHRIGTKMLNKRDNTGMPIPESIYQSLYLYYNGHKKIEELTADEKSYLNNVTVKDVKHEITKDRRYTHSDFFFHVPITFNVNAENKDIDNNDVMSYLKNNPDVNIIGIDRGERHLIYLTLINQKGEIIKQKTFNTINSFNYHAKLEQREKERDEARKSWMSVSKIKDLKEGFLSAVIHEISTMMIEYNAIVVLEDLNFGFKRGRFKVERQVYQKFEKMLIDKLNYFCIKDVDSIKDGGILRGYQLTQKFNSFQRLGKQSGFLFYIPAAYTSKIDPVTGFVNHFNFHDLTNTDKRKSFFEKMDRIEMKNGNIEFEFDYRNFKTYQTDFQNIWIVSTKGKRIIWENKEMIDFYPTKSIISAFEKIGVKIQDGDDLKEIILSINDARFFNTLFYAFRATLQMRNSNPKTEEDYIISPVEKNGIYFCSSDEANKGKDKNGNWKSTLPVDADANGAYHIALKGLYLLQHLEEEKIEHAEWLKYMVEKPYKA